MIVYDIGANIGYHTNAFAKFAKHVYAFEPNELNYKLLEMNTFHDKNVTLFDYAISNDIGITQIEKFELGKPGNYGECKLTEDGQLCDMTYIDYLVRTGNIQPPHVIKIDVEGHEYPVFQGMSETIKNHLPVIFYEAHHCDTASIYDIPTFSCMYSDDSILLNRLSQAFVKIQNTLHWNSHFTNYSQKSFLGEFYKLINNK